MGARADLWDEPKRKYLERIQKETGIALELEGRGARWASGPAGAIGIMASASSASRDGERWWLGLDENEFDKRQPLGLILLCQSKAMLLDFGLSRQNVIGLLPRLGRDQSRGERKFNLVRRRDHYWLQIPGEDGVDLTHSLGDLSWLSVDAAPVRVRSQGPEGTSNTPPSDTGRDGDRAFFARVRGGLLEPLDPTGLPEGAVVKVRATIANSAPQISALRLIVAAGGPPNLPPDLAEHHDYYAHGTRK